MAGLDAGHLAVGVGVGVDVAAVVGEEDDDRVVGDAQLVELVEEAPEALVNAPEHRGHDGVALVAAGVLLRGEAFRDLLLVAPGAVDGVVPEVEEEWPPAVGLDELEGLVGDAIGDVLAVGAGRDVASLEAIGRVVARRPGVGRTVERHVEALDVRPVLGPQAEMPLADVAGAVARVAERLGDGVLRGRQEAAARGREDLAVRRSRLGQERLVGRQRRQVTGGRGDPQAGGVLAREDAGAGRRAEGAGGVGVHELHRAPGQPPHVRRLVVLAAVDRAVHPAHVIDEEEDDVGLAAGCRACEAGCGERSGTEAEGFQEIASRAGCHWCFPFS